MKELQKEFDSFLNGLKQLGKIEDNVMKHIQNRIENGFIGILDRLENCESPIEQILALELGRILDSSILNEFGMLSMDKQIECSFTDKKDKKEKVRVDFLVSFFDRDKEINEQFVIECDGHDFHDRTKEQAAKDRRRDRYFAKQGIMVIRFTGSEITQDPSWCAREIENIIRTNVVKEYSMKTNQEYLPF